MRLSNKRISLAGGTSAGVGVGSNRLSADQYAREIDGYGRTLDAEEGSVGKKDAPKTKRQGSRKASGSRRG